jgi:hypothetical protein
MNHNLGAAPTMAPQLDNLGGNSLASVGVGGLGIVLLAILIMLIKQGGNAKIQQKFKGLHAVGMAFTVEVLLAAAGGIWDWPGTLLHNILNAITANPQIHIGIAVVAFVILSFIFLRNHKPKRGAWAGFTASVAFRMAGGWFIYPSIVIASGVASMGVH